MGYDNQPRLLLLNKVSHVIDAVLHGNGFLSRNHCLALALLLSCHLQSLLLLNLGLWSVLVK